MKLQDNKLATPKVYNVALIHDQCVQNMLIAHFHSAIYICSRNNDAEVKFSKKCHTFIGNIMNRLAAYSYLTRYSYGHAGSRRLFTVALPERS